MRADDDWTSDGAQARAVYVLEYLVTGDAEGPEYALPLNKVLCGMPLENPLPPAVPLKDGEAEECRALLAAVTGHWSALKNTSPEGFRRSFLQRPGLLDRTETGWVLRVEPAPHDPLLQTIPWGYGMVRLSWMPQPLEVEW